MNRATNSVTQLRTTTISRATEKRCRKMEHSGGWVYVFRIGIPLVLLIGAGSLATWLIETQPKARRRPPKRHATLVEVEPITFTSEQAVVEAMGAVQAAREVDIHPRVRGEIIAMNQEIVPGGLLKKDQTMFRIDPTDYKLAMKQSQAMVTQAQANLRVEQGSQSIARKEYEMLGEAIGESDRDLVLRKPQLENAKATLESAEAAFNKAKVDLMRTTIKAPFNAVVRARLVDIGTRVTESNNLATLVGTDAYWIEVSVPVDQLKWLRIPQTKGEQGSPVRVYDEAAWGSGQYREGHVLRLAAELEKEGRMARVIVEVEDPLSLERESASKPKLLIGSYVRVELNGSMLESVAPIDRSLLRDGNRVWIMDQQGKLDIRQVEIAFEQPKRVLVSAGVNPGEKLVVTDIPTPVHGMALKTSDRTQAPDETKQNIAAKQADPDSGERPKL